MKKFKIRKESSSGVAHVVRYLDHEIFGADVPLGKRDVEGSTWWIARDENGDPVGFGGARMLENWAVVLVRCGVLYKARGNGLQRRFLTTRTRWGREQGAKAAITYTLHDNDASVNNLIRAGFRVYDPDWKWVGRDNILYWWKDL